MIQVPQCIVCKHFVHKGGVVYTCPAFPDRIPRDVFFSDEVHDTVLPNQTGDTVFERMAESDLFGPPDKSDQSD